MKKALILVCSVLFILIICASFLTGQIVAERKFENLINAELSKRMINDDNNPPTGTYKEDGSIHIDRIDPGEAVKVPINVPVYGEDSAEGKLLDFIKNRDKKYKDWSGSEDRGSDCDDGKWLYQNIVVNNGKVIRHLAKIYTDENTFRAFELTVPGQEYEFTFKNRKIINLGYPYFMKQNNPIKFPIDGPDQEEFMESPFIISGDSSGVPDSKTRLKIYDAIPTWMALYSDVIDGKTIINISVKDLQEGYYQFDASGDTEMEAADNLIAKYNELKGVVVQ